MVAEKDSLQGFKGLFSFFMLLLLLGVLRVSFPERSMNEVGIGAPANYLFVSGLLVLVVWISSALGKKLLILLGIERLSSLEWMTFSPVLGLGVLAYIIFALGLLGTLRAEAIAMLLILIGVAAWKELGEILNNTWHWFKHFPKNWVGFEADEKILFILASLIFSLAFLQSLTPPWDYDGLLYHLQGPRLFLEAGRIYPVKDNWLVYYPFTPEMLFIIGMSVDSDTYAKLVHWFSAILLVLSTYACGRRYLGRSSAWLSAAILIGIPIFPIWSSFAYGDMTWAVFEFLAFYAVLIWAELRQKDWLLLAGILMGFALGSKYMALGGAAALGIWLVWKSRTQGWRAVLKNSALFGGVALVVGAPWYLKNWLWTGSPFYPLFLSLQDPIRVKWDLWMAYMNGFGAGRSMVDYLLLPIHLYSQYHRFGTFLGSIEIPSLLFPFLILFPWVRKTEQTNACMGIATVGFIFWAIGPQQTRFLLPIFPLLSLATTHVIIDLTSRLTRPGLGKVLSRGLVYGMVATTLVYSVLFFAYIAPLKVSLGLESKESFLERNIALYPMMQYIRKQLPEQARVLMLWDGRGYYCDQRCLPDTSQSQWTALVSGSWDVNQVVESLHQQGVTHLLFSLQDAQFISQYDISGLQARALAFLLKEFATTCTQEVAHTDYYSLLELTCPLQHSVDGD